MRFWERVAFKFGCAFKGLWIAVLADNSFKVHIIFLVLTAVVATVLGFSLVEWAIVLLAIGLVFVSELFNTAIEHLVRMFTQEYHELAEKLLDISAGAVLFAAIVALSIGTLVTVNHLWIKL